MTEQLMRAALRAALASSHLPFLLPLSSSSRLRCKISYTAAASPEGFPQLHEDCSEFLPWLRGKTDLEISSVLSLGFSSHGRSLFASKSIQAGDCIVKVPYRAHLTSDRMRPEIEPLLVDDFGDISRLAVVLLVEKKLGQDSEWAPYIKSFPCINEMHNMIFWNGEELDMVQQSPTHQETLDQKAYIEKEFQALKSAVECLPQIFGDITLDDFMHAYALVVSRAWRTSKGISLIPFADFLNHDGASEAILLCDDDKEISEVIADRGYAAGAEVLIRYGKFPNATLLLDFGFTLPYNPHDQVRILMNVPLCDPLYTIKSKLLHKHCSPADPGVNDLKSSGSSFIVKEVKSVNRNGKGIPQALRAFARVLSTTSLEELKALGTEADKNDGRLARRPLRNNNAEIQAHRILLSRFAHMIQGHDASIKDLESVNSFGITGRLALRRQMAADLLKGELRVLKAACAWLTSYCASLSLSCKREF